MKTHQFQPDPDPPDYRGKRRCVCGLPLQNSVHDVPDRSDDDVSDRIVGEAETVDT